MRGSSCEVRRGAPSVAGAVSSATLPRGLGLLPAQCMRAYPQTTGQVAPTIQSACNRTSGRVGRRAVLHPRADARGSVGVAVSAGGRGDALREAAPPSHECPPPRTYRSQSAHQSIFPKRSIDCRGVCVLDGRGMARCDGARRGRCHAGQPSHYLSSHTACAPTFHACQRRSEYKCDSAQGTGSLVFGTTLGGQAASDEDRPASGQVEVASPTCLTLRWRAQLISRDELRL